MEGPVTGGLLRVSTHKLGEIPGLALYASKGTPQMLGPGDVRTLTTCHGCPRKIKQAKSFLPILSRPRTMPTKPNPAALPTVSGSPPLSRNQNRQHSDFRSLYYSREIRQVPPPSRQSGVSDGVQKFRIWQSLDHSQIEEHSTIPTTEEMQMEITLDTDQSKRRGYFRLGAMLGSLTPSRKSPQSPKKEVSPSPAPGAIMGRRPANETLDSLPGIFSHTEVVGHGGPGAVQSCEGGHDGPRVLHSQRRHQLLYSRLCHWEPKPVSYNNFFLPEIGSPGGPGYVNVFQLNKQDDNNNEQSDNNNKQENGGDKPDGDTSQGDITNEMVTDKLSTGR